MASKLDCSCMSSCKTSAARTQATVLLSISSSLQLALTALIAAAKSGRLLTWFKLL